jgi:transposase, IS30 family
VECVGRCPRGRCVTHLRGELGAGYKTYRNGQVVGFIAPLDRLAVREISTRYLSQDERIEIADLRRAGLGVRAIAARIGRSPST